jgi:hypothetical protein
MTFPTKPDHDKRQFMVRMMHLSVFCATHATWFWRQVTAVLVDVCIRAGGIPALGLFVKGMGFAPLAHIGGMANLAVALLRPVIFL